MQKSLAKPFLIVLVIGVLISCFLVFRPFLIELIIAAVLVSILHRPYLWFTKFLKGRRHLAAFIMCFLALALIIFPLSEVMIVAAKKSTVAYTDVVNFLNSYSAPESSGGLLGKVKLLGLDNSSLKNLVIDVVDRSSNMMVNSATAIIKGTANFFFSLIIIILTMFFFFADGDRMLKKLMYWSPLPNKYDVKLFQKFKDVSYSTIISTFVVITAQGLIGAAGYMIIGLPAFFAGILIAIFSLIPMVGSMLIYVPTGIYLLLVGQIWQGIFILLWGFLIIGTIDNVIRAWMIKGRAHINPIFVFLSILGGIALFGFWGIVLGPLVISIAVTVFHIYELEFVKDLELPSEVKDGK